MMTYSPAPRRADLWLIDLGEPIGSEAGFRRPALIISDDRFNVHGLAVVCPLTRTPRGYETHIEVEAGTAGLRETSYVQVEQVRTVSAERWQRHIGAVDILVMSKVETVIKYLLGL